MPINPAPDFINGTDAEAPDRNSSTPAKSSRLDASQAHLAEQLLTLLATRLRGFSLAHAKMAVANSIAELGGGEKRVRQRLRATLEWCESPRNRGLFFDSTMAELSAEWRRSSHFLKLVGIKTARGFYKKHALTVAAVAGELDLPRDYRNSILKSISRLVRRDRCHTLKNCSDKINRARWPGERVIDLVQADHRAILKRREELRFKLKAGLATLTVTHGWVLRFITITLPVAFHAGTRSNALANSPSYQAGKDLLLHIWRKSVGKSSSASNMGGAWFIETQDSGTPHVHLLVAFCTAERAENFRIRLCQIYECETERYRQHRVFAGFGIYEPVNWPAAISFLAANPADLDTLVGYVTKCSFDPDSVDTTAGRRYSLIGCLRGERVPIPVEALASELRPSESQSVLPVNLPDVEGRIHFTKRRTVPHKSVKLKHVQADINCPKSSAIDRVFICEKLYQEETSAGALFNSRHRGICVVRRSARRNAYCLARAPPLVH